ncbi:hypothetical protein E05_35390 [Plautia stali symbiont]|nr:hypothetical protein E05_35390 [Plautia stali symbiont]
MFPTTPVAMLTHHGDPQRINDTAAQFIAWRKSSGASPVRSSQTFGVAPHDPTSNTSRGFSVSPLRFGDCAD